MERAWLKRSGLKLPEGVEEMRTKHGVIPGLAVVLVGDDPASAVYVRNKGLAAEAAGMYSESVTLPSTASMDEVLGEVRRLNEDSRIHGLLVQLPLPDHLDENTVMESISPEKDVDGLHPFNMGLLGGWKTEIRASDASGDTADADSIRSRHRGQARRGAGEIEHRREAYREPPDAEGKRRELHGNRVPHSHTRPR